MKKKPTYKIPVSICAIALVVGAIILAILMETRQMAPPRKYEVDMSRKRKSKRRNSRRKNPRRLRQRWKNRQNPSSLSSFLMFRKDRRNQA